jgi:ATF/CREB family transcription factor
MFPAPSPNSQALFAQLASGGATPNTLDFHRTALSAAAKREQSNGGKQQDGQQQAHTQPSQQPTASVQASEMPNGTTVKAEPKPASGPFDPHDNDAANGLFMLAQGRNGAPNPEQFAATTSATGNPHPAAVAPQGMSVSPQMASINGGSVSGRGMSEGTNGSEDSEPTKPAARGKKRNPPSTNSRRKADEQPAKAPPAKKAKASSIGYPEDAGDSDMEDDMKDNGDGTKSKMTDEEKRKNFLERNRVAALKCRQRKKLWLANLQSKVEMFSSENDALTAQITQLREEVVNLKTLLLAHKDCPVTQQQGIHGGFMSQVVEPYNPQMNPYGMAAPMQAQQVMAGQGVQRRFS